LEQLQERLKSSSFTDRPQLKEEVRMLFQTLNVDFHLLKDFSSLNYTGFSKILKKHDKVCPRNKMKVNYIRNQMNRQPVFGILDELYRYQVLTQQLFADIFNSGNRIEAEMELESSFAKVFEQSMIEDPSPLPSTFLVLLPRHTPTIALRTPSSFPPITIFLRYPSFCFRAKKAGGFQETQTNTFKLYDRHR
jgi:hypothetical protein